MLRVRISSSLLFLKDIKRYNFTPSSSSTNNSRGPLTESFDPNKVTSLVPHGKVYEEITIIDSWGKIEVTGGLLIANDFSHVKVNANNFSLDTVDKVNISTPKWKLSIKQGWRVVQTDRDYQLVRNEMP